MTLINKELRRRTVQPFLHYKRPVIIELVPGDVIRLRFYDQRLGSAVSIQAADLHYELVRRKAAALKGGRGRSGGSDEYRAGRSY